MRRGSIMRINKILLTTLIALCLLGIASPSINHKPNDSQDEAIWTFLVYIAADNNLAPYALYNIKDMSAGITSAKGLNVLVQWDKPSDKKTWRYKITPGGKTDAGTLSSEMGYDPATELFNSIQWAFKTYPADHYALILWDHGSGVQDFSPAAVRNSLPYLYVQPNMLQRGILYDDEQKTCLTNKSLAGVLEKTKQLIGKKLDVIAMDACLMAMVEVAYQMNDLADVFVGSEQTIPGNGYPYSQFLRPLSLNPAKTTPLILAQNMVASYKNFYTTQELTTDFTLSAIDIKSINIIKKNIDQFIAAVEACSTIDATKTKNMILAARKACLSFEMPEYIDLYSFYVNILNQTKKASPKSLIIFEHQGRKSRIEPPTKEYQKALDALNDVIQDGLDKINQTVLANENGPVYAGAKGLSIYYPASGEIDLSYLLTSFAQETEWSRFIESYC